MLKLASGSVVESLGGGIGDEEKDLAVKSIRTMYMTGMFGDLPEEAQLHPGMQERVWASLPEMDESTMGMMSYIDSLTKAQKKDLHARLKHRSNPVMRIAQECDIHAKAFGVSKVRRARTRMMFSHVATRMAHQSPDLVIEEVLSKSRKLLARAGSAEDVENMLAARFGEAAFSERKKRYDEIMSIWEQRCGNTSYSNPGEGLLVAGGVLMGFTIVFVILGAVLLAGLGSISGAVMLTIGGILLIIGIVLLAVGGAKQSKWKTSQG
jgi:hypothetical protein